MKSTTCDKPLRAEPRRYTVAFPGETVLQFKYKVIQLNRMSWRKFVHQPNPVAAALMSKMKMAERDRPKVKLECLRLLATLKLNPARTKLIGNFIENYLQLNAVETQKYEREFAALAPEERKATVEMMNSWERTGFNKGLQEGKENLVMRQIRKRFGSLSPQVMQRLDQMPADQLDELGEALFDFVTLADLETWLSQSSAV
jgi:hypothetical protein